MPKTIFTADRFVSTEFSTAQEKARFCNHFARFVLGGFPRKLFKPAFYRRLSNIFGHIANYDETGFYEVWFATPAKQRQFVRRVHEWVPVGDPSFCWCDVERELKSWAAMTAEAVEAVLTDNERKAEEAAQAETDRRSALVGQICQEFTVLAKSTNLGSFGHRQYILRANDSSVWKVHRIYLYPWEIGEIITVPLVNGEPDWSSIPGVECPERMPDCLQLVEA
jgi:hypothetical protein